MPADQTSLSVAQLVRHIRTTLENSLGSVWVEGEISNFKLQGSGHAYFTLKDELAQISCVFFKGAILKSPVTPDNGLKVKIYAEVSVYEPRGQVQLVVKVMQPAGLGSLQQQFEALKQKLLEEGLFDHERKKAIPTYPERIGIITSPTGAVIQDIRHVFERRAPWIQPYLFPVRVQGNEAAGEIARAITLWNTPQVSNLPEVDLLIVGRGGGSLEDLWCFNEEIVARAIAESDLPIISAVGHETDFTIADFVADMRAPTPTAAAELASPDGSALARQITHRWSQAKNSLEKIMSGHDLRLDVYSRGILSTSPEKVLRDFIQLVDEQDDRLAYGTEDAIKDVSIRLQSCSLKLLAGNPSSQILWNGQTLEKIASRFRQIIPSAQETASSRLNDNEKLLRALGPESAFKRGYAIVKNDKGLIIRDPQSVKRGENLSVTLEKGSLDVNVL